MQGSKIKRGIIKQVAIFFLAASVLTAIINLVSQRIMFNKSVTEEVELVSSHIAQEVSDALTEYPSHDWLISYWYENCDKLDIEYDSDFSSGTKTEQKLALLRAHQPSFQPKYATTEQVKALPAEDQKLFAEITYSWLITRVDQIKRANEIDFLFCILTQDPFTEQFFLFSAADKDSKRGTNYEEVYPLGVKVTVSDSQQEAMGSAKKQNTHLAEAGNYMDYYSYICSIDGKDVMVGLTLNLSGIKDSINTQTRRGSINALLHQLFLAAICLALIFAFVLKPLKKVQEIILEYKQGKDSEKARADLSEIKSHNEIGQLSEDVSDLTKEIDEYLNEISTNAAERERLSAELGLASRIQAHSLPHTFPPFPDRKEFDIYANMDPAREIGGDFYDFYMIDDDHVAMIIADVSGKGVPAALFMMVSMIIIHSISDGQTSPAALLEALNNRISARNPEEMFFSMWMGVLEISTGKMTASNAGHEYPAVKIDDTYELLKDKHGLVVGGMPGQKYTEYEIQLQPGSKIFVYTDGLPEASDSDNNMFGLDRIVETLNKEPEADIRKTLENMKASVDGFVKDAEQFDDMTLMCLVYNGAGVTAKE